MIRIMQGMRHFSAFVLLSTLAAAAACGNNEPPARAPTETTSAPVIETVPKADFLRAERERDEARDQLRDETTRRDAERTKLQGELQTRKEHDELTARVWGSIDAAESELKALKDKVARVPAKQRQKTEKAIADAKAKQAVLEHQARKIPLEHGAAWSDLKKSVEAAIDDLQSAVHTASE